MSKRQNIRCVVNTKTGVAFPYTDALAARPHMRAYRGDPHNPPGHLLANTTLEESAGALNLDSEALAVPALEDEEPEADSKAEARQSQDDIKASVAALRTKEDVKAFAAQAGIELDARKKLDDMKKAVVSALTKEG